MLTDIELTQTQANRLALLVLMHGSVVNNVRVEFLYNYASMSMKYISVTYFIRAQAESSWPEVQISDTRIMLVITRNLLQRSPIA